MRSGLDRWWGGRTRSARRRLGGVDTSGRACPAARTVAGGRGAGQGQTLRDAPLLTLCQEDLLDAGVVGSLPELK
jgi:hypothetical protein